jgi:hypothetical protein
MASVGLPLSILAFYASLEGAFWYKYSLYLLYFLHHDITLSTSGIQLVVKVICV